MKALISSIIILISLSGCTTRSDKIAKRVINNRHTSERVFNLRYAKVMNELSGDIEKPIFSTCNGLKYAVDLGIELLTFEYFHYAEDFHYVEDDIDKILKKTKHIYLIIKKINCSTENINTKYYDHSKKIWRKIQ
jgi:hypothetical protein